MKNLFARKMKNFFDAVQNKTSQELQLLSTVTLD